MTGCERGLSPAHLLNGFGTMQAANATQLRDIIIFFLISVIIAIIINIIISENVKYCFISSLLWNLHCFSCCLLLP